MKEVILHVGFHKTATSSIQQTLAANPDSLSGYVYPIFHLNGTPIANHSIPFYSMFCTEPSKYMMNIKMGVSEKVKEVNENYLNQLLSFMQNDKLIISGEDISVLPEKKLILLKEIFEKNGYLIKVYCAVRKPYSFMCSELQERVKSAGYSISQNLITVLRKSEEIEKIKKVFPDNVDFYSFEKDVASGFGVVESFLKRIGLNEKEFSIFNSNEGIGNLTTRLFSYLNRHFPMIVDGKVSEKHKKKAGLNFDQDKFLLTQAELNLIKSDLDEENIKIKSILGDAFIDSEYRVSPRLNISFDKASLIYKSLKDDALTSKRLLDFISKFADFDMLDLKSLSSQDADLFRDLSELYRDKDYAKSTYLMLLAEKIRPNGPFIKKRVEEYKSVCQGVDLNEVLFDASGSKYIEMLSSDSLLSMSEQAKSEVFCFSFFIFIYINILRISEKNVFLEKVEAIRKKHKFSVDANLFELFFALFSKGVSEKVITSLGEILSLKEYLELRSDTENFEVFGVLDGFSDFLIQKGFKEVDEKYYEMLSDEVLSFCPVFSLRVSCALYLRDLKSIARKKRFDEIKEIALGEVKLGVAIVTYNRLDFLKENVSAVKKYTKLDYELVVADDGSLDGTKEWCYENYIACISGENRGVVWNKNRGLYYLANKKECHVVILLEDDCLPNEKGWEKDWVLASLIWGHINYAHKRILNRKEALVSGNGSVEKPFISKLVTGQCTACSAVSLEKVGYLNPIFKGYGCGHVEWTERFLSHGYNGVLGNKDHVFACIDTGLLSNDAPTHKDPDQLNANKTIKMLLKGDVSYKEPWVDENDKALFLKEVSSVC